MKKILFTSSDNWAPLLLRLLLSIVLFAHGAQKLFGWFEGFGFTVSMKFFTELVGVPWIVGFLVILLEVFGSIALLLGFATRIFGFLVTGLTVGIVLTSHLRNGFFMNWFGTQMGEGYEYFILMLAIALSLVVSGGGKWSVDALFAKSHQ